MEAVVTWSERSVARVIIAGCAAGALAACDGDGGSAVVGSASASSQSSGTTVTGQPGAAGGCSVPVASSVDAASTLVAGPTNGLPRSEAAGEKLVIEAVVVDAGCSPADGANLTVWHTDARGHYGPHTDACCYFGGTVRSDQHGRVRLESIRPGQYPEPGAPPAHIHMSIEHLAGRLETEIVFDATPVENVVPVVLRSISPQQGERYWYGEAVLTLGR